MSTDDTSHPFLQDISNELKESWQEHAYMPYLTL